MVQGAGFEPAKHYAQRSERCPFDRSGTPAETRGLALAFNPASDICSGAGGRIRTCEALRTGT